MAAGLCACLPASLQADPSVPARSDVPIALLVDMHTGQVLHSREADRRFIPASVTKVMTAYIAFEMLDDGRLTSTRQVEVSEKVAKEWSGEGSSMFLEAGQRVTVDELLHGITTVSANDACVLIAEATVGSLDNWLKLMNDTAAELGMSDSHFGSPNGFPDEGETYVSARDLALLARAMIARHPELYRRYFGKRGMEFNGIAQDNHDPISGKVAGADGIKTGHTNEAGYTFLGSAERDGKRLVMVLAGVDRASVRNQAARDYIEWGYSDFDTKVLLPMGLPVGEARVQGGALRRVGLVAAVDIRTAIPKGRMPAISTALRYRGPVMAPFEKGEVIAELEVRIEGFAPYFIPLEATESVDEANLWQRLRNGVLGLFG